MFMPISFHENSFTQNNTPHTKKSLLPRMEKQTFLYHNEFFIPTSLDHKARQISHMTAEKTALFLQAL